MEGSRVIGPLCIIQARMNSTRLPGKMLRELGGETLIARAYRLACDAFHEANVVIACPGADGDAFRAAVPGAQVFAWAGDENDVLARFYHCAGRYRWNPQSVIVRWTPDDPFKVPAWCRAVAEGARYPVEQSVEAFTMATLARAQHTTALDDPVREHLGNHRQLTPFAPPPCPDGTWTIDTEEDLLAAGATLLGYEKRDDALWHRTEVRIPA